MTGKPQSMDRLTRIGLLVSSSNTVMENDLHSHLPKDRYSVHTARMFLVDTTREAQIEMIEKHAPLAADNLGTAQPDLVVFGSTSGGSLFGLRYDARLRVALGERCNCEVMGVVTAVAEALERRGSRRVAIITPYVQELTDAVARSIEGPDREIAAAFGMGISTNVKLADPTPAEIATFARGQLTGVKYDAVFISCSNFRGMEAAQLLESEVGLPVITSNSSVIEAIRLKMEGASFDKEFSV